MLELANTKSLCFFAFPNENIVHFATWNNSFSGGLQNIFNNILKNIVN